LPYDHGFLIKNKVFKWFESELSLWFLGNQIVR
jgi:hypothetical protein